MLQENNKSPNRNKFATPKSPSRKTKSRLAKANLNKTSYNDLNERNRLVGVGERPESIVGNDNNTTNQLISQSMSQQYFGMQKQSLGKCNLSKLTFCLALSILKAGYILLLLSCICYSVEKVW